MHLHTLSLDIPKSDRVFCSGCDIQLRLATADEARFIDMTNGITEGGPMWGPIGTIVVPVDFSLYQEA